MERAVSSGYVKASLNESFMKDFMGINYHTTSSFFAYVATYLRGERKRSFIICERSVITMKFLWRYLVHNIGNCAMKLCTVIGLIQRISVAISSLNNFLSGNIFT
jgi:hypothetical protein